MHQAFSFLERECVRLEEVFPGHIRESFAGQSGRKLIADQVRSAGWNAHESFKNHPVERLLPAIFVQEAPGRFPDGALRRTLAEDLERATLGLDDGRFVRKCGHRS